MTPHSKLRAKLRDPWRGKKYKHCVKAGVRVGLGLQRQTEEVYTMGGEA